MSTGVELGASPAVSSPQPTRPWQRSRSERRSSWVLPVAMALVAWGILRFTGVAGLDGWAITYALVMFAAAVVAGLRRDSRVRRDLVAAIGVKALAVMAFAPWLSILLAVVFKGYKAIHLGYFTGDMRITSPDDELNLGGMGHAIVGSLIMVAIATAVTLPLGIMSGVYLTEVRGRLSVPVRFVVQAMSGVPSIVAGLFAYAVIVKSTGFSGISGSVALAVLMLPTVARTSEEILKLVPEEIRQAGYALGARQWRTTMMIVLPTVRSGLITAGILGVARVIGETAPLLLTALAHTSYNLNPLDGAMSSMPTYVFGLLQLGTDYATARAWSGSLVLIAFVFALFAVARRAGGRSERRGR